MGVAITRLPVGRRWPVVCFAKTSRQALGAAFQRNQLAERGDRSTTRLKPSVRRRSNVLLEMPWNEPAGKTSTSSDGRMPRAIRRLAVRRDGAGRRLRVAPRCGRSVDDFFKTFPPSGVRFFKTFPPFGGEFFKTFPPFRLTAR